MNRRAPGVLYREAELVRRAADQAEGEDAKPNRTYEFVVATEAPVRVGGYGIPEVLRMSGCRLRRFRKNPVVLDTHGWGIKSILGTAEWRVEGTKSIAKITLDETPEGEAARLRIESGSLRTCSIGYRPNWRKARELREGDVDGDVTGPAIVQREWEPYEITLCPVPADEDAVRRRSFNTFAGRCRGRTTMSRMSYSGLPAPADSGDEIDQDVDLGEDEGATEERSAPPAKPKTIPAPAPFPAKGKLALLPSERAARDADALKRQVMAITPRGLEAVAERCLLEGLDLDETREALKKAHAKRSKPNGTPEPVEEPEAERSQDQGAEGLTPDAVERALKGLRS